MSGKKIIFTDSAENQAVFESRTGWWDSFGRFWGNDKHMAQYSSATHRKCDKYPIHPATPVNSYCPMCYEDQAIIKYKDMPSKQYDGKTPVVILNTDQYFFDRESIEDYCDEHNLKPEDLKLVFCRPVYFKHIYPEDIYCDILPEDFSVDDISPELSEAFFKLNELIRTKIVASWVEGNIKVIWSKQ